MTPEEKSLLERTYKLAEDNNSILKSMRRAQRFSLIFRALYWFVIIGASIGLFYFVQPYFEQVMDMFNVFKGGAETIQTMPGWALDLLK